MTTIEPDTLRERVGELDLGELSSSFHASFFVVREKLKKWVKRFPFSANSSILNDLQFLFLMAPKQFFDQRSPDHLFRIVVSLHLMQKKLLRATTLSPHARHLEIRWLPTKLIFPFCTKPVQCLSIGFNISDRYEIFDEENVVLALQKHLPQLRLVKDSSYVHTSAHKNIKLFYFEIDKKDGLPLSIQERGVLKNNLESIVRKSIQTLSPTVFMRHVQEETYKHIIILNNEITSLNDIPQVYITFEAQNSKEIVFQVILVQITPFHPFSLKERFLDCSCVLHRHLTVRAIEDHPIEALVFSLNLSRVSGFLRSDGSLDFYAARQRVTDLLRSVIGEFRDYNGGIIVKQQEQLNAFKECCNYTESDSHELVEIFFYELLPLENQIVFSSQKLAALFHFFLEHRREPLPKGSQTSFKICRLDEYLLLTVHAKDRSLADVLSGILQESPSETKEIAYNFMHVPEGLFFNSIFNGPETEKTKQLLRSLKGALDQWELKKNERQTLHIGMEHSVVSLDPRIGGEGVSGDVLRLLFEGLTRYGQNGALENGVAKSISISPCGKHYTFHLRHSLWNDRSPVTAYDFEYAWKKILSPPFKTFFASYFYPIKNAQEAKEGKVSPEGIGIKAIDDFTLQVELVNPAPYFLQFTALPLYAPIHRLTDQQHPQWPNQSELHYPCNGPFQLKMNRPSQGFKFVKNPYYFDSHQITLDEIILTLLSPVEAFQAFQNNELDWIGNPLGSWYPFFGSGKDDRIVSLPNSNLYWVHFNTRSPPFHNVKLRQAFAHAVQRSKLIEGSFLPITPAFSPLLNQKSGHAEARFPDYNPENACKLLHEGLSEMGLKKEDLPTISFMFLEKGMRENIAVNLRQQFKECLGIECELKPLPWKTLFNSLTSGNFQMGTVYWTSLVDDPVYTLNAFKTGNSNLNHSKWLHPQFEQFLNLSDREVNPYQRSFYLFEAEKILCQEMPIVPLFYQPLQALVKKDLDVSLKPPIGPFNISRSLKRKESVEW